MRKTFNVSYGNTKNTTKQRNKKVKERETGFFLRIFLKVRIQMIENKQNLHNEKE